MYIKKLKRKAKRKLKKLKKRSYVKSKRIKIHKGMSKFERHFAKTENKLNDIFDKMRPAPAFKLPASAVAAATKTTNAVSTPLGKGDMTQEMIRNVVRTEIKAALPPKPLKNTGKSAVKKEAKKIAKKMKK